MIYRRFSPEIEEAFRRVGFDRLHEVEISPAFLEFIENNPLPSGHSYLFTFDDGREVGVMNTSDTLPPGAINSYPSCH